MDLLVTIGLSLVGLVALAFPLLLVVGVGLQILNFRFVHLIKKKYPDRWRTLQGSGGGDPSGLSQVLAARRYARTIAADDPADVVALKRKLLEFPKSYWGYYIAFAMIVDAVLILAALSLMNA